MKEWIDQLEQQNGIVPRDAFEALAEQQEEAAPYLVALIQKVTNHAADFETKRLYNGHMYAAFLLAQFREKTLLPVFLDFLSLPTQTLDSLFGDLLIESGGQIIASVTGKENLAMIQAFIENENVDLYARGAGLQAMVILTLNGDLERTETLQYFRSLLHHPWKVDSDLMIATVIAKCDDLYPDDVYDDIKSAYEKMLVDTNEIALSDIHRTLKKSKESVWEKKKTDSYNQFIKDAVHECMCIEKAAAAYQRMQQSISVPFTLQSKTIIAEPKIGRNDPCPCGSGKKYKKCCGK